jgi:hypothetical protein
LDDLGDDPQYLRLGIRHALARWRGENGDPARAAASLTARRSRAYWRARAGDDVGACEEFAEVVDDARRLLGEDHPFLQIVRDQIDHPEL